MTEIHPFGNFVPKKSRYLILGSFPGKPDNFNNWFYGSSRNQFWRIMEVIYNQRLGTIFQKQNLLTKMHIAIGDVILSCDRSEGTNSDRNLSNLSYNTTVVNKILAENNIQQIFFTSRFAKNIFIKEFKEIVYQYPEIKFITLPSPSPRYAVLNLSDKIREYKNLLPKL